MVGACGFLATNGRRATGFNPFPIRRMHRAAAGHWKRADEREKKRMKEEKREKEREREREGKKRYWGDTGSLILLGGVTRETRKSSLRIHLILAQELLFLLLLLLFFSFFFLYFLDYLFFFGNFYFPLSFSFIFLWFILSSPSFSSSSSSSSAYYPCRYLGRDMRVWLSRNLK